MNPHLRTFLQGGRATAQYKMKNLTNDQIRARIADRRLKLSETRTQSRRTADTVARIIELESVIDELNAELKRREETGE